MNGFKDARYAAVALWVAAIVCFVGSWFYHERRLVAVGAALLALYVILAARTRGGLAKKQAR